MLRAAIVVSLSVAAAATPLRTATAAEVPTAGIPSVRDGEEPGTHQPSPAARAAVVSGAAERPRPEFLLGSLQLVLGYGAEAGAFGVMAGTHFTPKELGIRSDYGSALFFVSLVPAAAAGAVCGAGLFSSSYRGRCWPTFLGAYAGATLGIVLGVLAAPSPGPDDTAEFEQSMAAAVGMLLLSPIGAVIGYHAGKREIPRERPATDRALAASTPDDGRLVARPIGEPRRTAFASSVPSLMLPLVNLTW